MNDLKQFFEDSKGSFSLFFKSYTEYFFELTKSVDVASVENLVKMLIEARERGSTIFIIGNGGSAATASHFTEDLALCAGAHEDKPFRALSLSDSTPYITALGNDEGYENVFIGQLRNLYKAGDVLIAFSASGNSSNLIKAIDYVNSKNGQTFGILGFDGGEAKKRCAQSITVTSPRGHYGPVESVHVLLMHTVSNYLFFKLSGEVKKL